MERNKTDLIGATKLEDIAKWNNMPRELWNSLSILRASQQKRQLRRTNY